MSELDEERNRVAQFAMEHPQPCRVCGDRVVVGIGTWVPDETQRLAAGAKNNKTPVFAFWVCSTHACSSEENDKLIRQAVLRAVRIGWQRKV